MGKNTKHPCFCLQYGNNYFIFIYLFITWWRKTIYKPFLYDVLRRSVQQLVNLWNKWFWSGSYLKLESELRIMVFNLFILKKKLLLQLPPPSLSLKMSRRKKKKTNSFRNIKFGIRIAFSLKMCMKPFSKTKHPHNLKALEVLYRLLSKFRTTFHWNTRVF